MTYAATCLHLKGAEPVMLQRSGEVESLQPMVQYLLRPDVELPPCVSAAVCSGI